MKSFLASTVFVSVAAVAAAALVTLVPLAHVAAGAAVLLIVIVFSAARSGAPRWFGLRQLAGLLFAALAIVLHWAALFGFGASGAEGFAALAQFDYAAALAVLAAPEGWAEAVQGLAGRTSYEAGGSVVTGAGLATAWAIEAALICLFGLLGGHAAWWRQRSRL